MAKQLVRNITRRNEDGSRVTIKAGEDVPTDLTDAEKARLERIGALIDTSESEYSDHTKAELAELAADRDLDVPDKATKADLVALLEADDAGAV